MDDELTEQQREVQRRIDEMTEQIDELIAARMKYMDENLPLVAKVQVGEYLYKTDGERLGKVTEIYRDHHWNPLYDDSMEVHYRYEDGGDTENTDEDIDLCSRKEAGERLLRDAASKRQEAERLLSSEPEREEWNPTPADWQRAWEMAHEPLNSKPAKEPKEKQ